MDIETDCGLGREKTIAHNHFQFNVIMCNLSTMSTKQSVSRVPVICLKAKGVVKGVQKYKVFAFFLLSFFFEYNRFSIFN